MQIKYKNQDDLLKIQSKQYVRHQKNENGSYSNSSSNAKTSPSTDNSHDAIVSEEIYDFSSQNQHTDTDYAEASSGDSKRNKQFSRTRASSDNLQSTNSHEHTMVSGKTRARISTDKHSLKDSHC